MRALCCLAVVVALSTASGALGAAKAPDWVRTAAATAEKDLPRGTAAHMLLNEETVDIAPTGTITRRERRAIRILTNDGKGHAFARTGYDRKADKLVSLKAWVISPSGKVTEFKAKDVIQTAVYSTSLELYGEAWQAVIYGGDSVVPGGVFAFEAIKEERGVFSQDMFMFQENIPCERSAFSVKVPKDWRVTGRVFNADGIEPSAAGDRFTWTMSRLPALPDEVMAPSTGAATPWLAVDYLRPEGTKGSSRSWSYAAWREVSEQFTPIHDDAAAPDATVRARAAAVAGSAASRLEEIRAICAYVQGLNYVLISMNSAYGGGMVPRAATRVLACGYGDCKDKTALLRSLLAARGIESYPMVLYAGDSQRVQESWPSPKQFNHCIAAIRVDDSFTGPAVVDVPELGRLLLFDPTSRYAPAGILPSGDQGGLALVLAGSKGALVRVTPVDSENGMIERRIRVRLDGLGDMAGTISETVSGNASVGHRGEWRERTPAQYHEFIEKWLGTTMPATRALKTVPVDDFAGANFKLDVEFEVPSYGRSLHDRLLVFKPVLLSRRGNKYLAAGERKSPVVVEAFSLKETAEFELPAGFRVEDMIEPVEIEAPFGTYRAAGRLDGDGTLVFERTYTLKPSVIPASEYAIVREFFEKVMEAEQGPVVLAREPSY